MLTMVELRGAVGKLGSTRASDSEANSTIACTRHFPAEPKFISQLFKRSSRLVSLGHHTLHFLSPTLKIKMSTAVAVWTVRVEPGKKTKFVALSDIHITGAALDAKLEDEKARSSVKFTYETPQAIDEDDEEAEPLPPITSAILCSLTPGQVRVAEISAANLLLNFLIQIEQSSLNIIIAEEDEVEFEIVGKK